MTVCVKNSCKFPNPLITSDIALQGGDWDVLPGHLLPEEPGHPRVPPGQCHELVQVLNLRYFFVLKSSTTNKNVVEKWYLVILIFNTMLAFYVQYISITSTSTTTYIRTTSQLWYCAKCSVNMYIVGVLNRPTLVTSFEPVDFQKNNSRTPIFTFYHFFSGPSLRMFYDNLV